DLRKGATLVLTEKQVAARKQAQVNYLAAYRQRIKALADTCKTYGIKPVFLTQPSLFGRGLDSVTGVDLETFKLGDGFNGRELWEVLELYNDELRAIATEENIPLIDLAAL